MPRFQKLPVVSGSGHVTRFITVGALGFVVQIAAFAILTTVGRWPWLPATIVAVELAVVHNFLWHDRWTWRDRSGARHPSSPAGHRCVESRTTRFVRFNMTTGLTSIAGNAVLMAVSVGVMRLPGAAANVLAVVTMSVVNFVVSDRWVFQTGAEGIEPVERNEDCVGRDHRGDVRGLDGSGRAGGRDGGGVESLCRRGRSAPRARARRPGGGDGTGVRRQPRRSTRGSWVPP
ncbi:MAG: hypothetical protein DMF98_19375 [Acidobacteria bacterium]|nr:MAG: hypothetical protein DMF98_19375 [Acidobacteriota bacterium]